MKRQTVPHKKKEFMAFRVSERDTKLCNLASERQEVSRSEFLRRAMLDFACRVLSDGAESKKEQS